VVQSANIRSNSPLGDEIFTQVGCPTLVSSLLAIEALHLFSNIWCKTTPVMVCYWDALQFIALGLPLELLHLRSIGSKEIGCHVIGLPKKSHGLYMWTACNTRIHRRIRFFFLGRIWLNVSPFLQCSRVTSWLVMGVPPKKIIPVSSWLHGAFLSHGESAESP
jgi:hypothetical protein